LESALGTPVGIEAQEIYMVDFTKNNMIAASQHVTDPASIAYVADVFHQYGTGGGASLLRRAGVNAGDSVDVINTKINNVDGDYKGRRDITASKLAPTYKPKMDMNDKQKLADGIAKRHTDEFTGKVDNDAIHATLDALDAKGTIANNDLDDIAGLLGFELD
jgi:hypothetical protein